jgi:hypothetical protein
MLHKIVGLPNLPKILIKIIYSFLWLMISAIASMYVINKNNQIDLNEEIEKDRKFEKIKKSEKSQREINQIIQSLEEGIVVIQNEKILFQNKIFDEILKQSRNKNTEEIMHMKLFRIVKNESSGNGLVESSHNGVDSSESGLSLAQLLL